MVSNTLSLREHQDHDLRYDYRHEKLTSRVKQKQAGLLNFCRLNKKFNRELRTKKCTCIFWIFLFFCQKCEEWRMCQTIVYFNRFLSHVFSKDKMALRFFLFALFSVSQMDFDVDTIRQSILCMDRKMLAQYFIVYS